VPLVYHKKVTLRDQSVGSREKICIASVGKEGGKKEVNGQSAARESRRSKFPFLQRSRRREFEEDRHPAQGRKLSVDIAKKMVRHPTPDHKASVESEFS